MMLYRLTDVYATTSSAASRCGDPNYPSAGGLPSKLLPCSVDP